MVKICDCLLVFQSPEQNISDIKSKIQKKYKNPEKTRVRSPPQAARTEEPFKTGSGGFGSIFYFQAVQSRALTLYTLSLTLSDSLPVVFSGPKLLNFHPQTVQRQSLLSVFHER